MKFNKLYKHLMESFENYFEIGHSKDEETILYLIDKDLNILTHKSENTKPLHYDYWPIQVVMLSVVRGRFVKSKKLCSVAYNNVDFEEKFSKHLINNLLKEKFGNDIEIHWFIK